VPELARELGAPAKRVAALAGDLERRGLVSAAAGSLDLTAVGQEALAKLIEAGRAELTALVDHWQRPDDQELGPVLRRLAGSLVAEIPAETAEDSARRSA
jgi:Mn-dependent DtxR family transcriptional regulator